MMPSSPPLAAFQKHQYTGHTGSTLEGVAVTTAGKSAYDRDTRESKRRTIIIWSLAVLVCVAVVAGISGGFRSGGTPIESEAPPAATSSTPPMPKTPKPQPEAAPEDAPEADADAAAAEAAEEAKAAADAKTAEEAKAAADTKEAAEAKAAADAKAVEEAKAAAGEEKEEEKEEEIEFEEEEEVDLAGYGHNLISEKKNYNSEEDIVLAYDVNAGKKNWIAIGKAGMDENGMLMSDEYIWNSYDNSWESYECTEEDACDSGGLIIHNNRGVVPPGTYQAYLCAMRNSPPYHIKATTEPFVVKASISITEAAAEAEEEVEEEEEKEEAEEEKEEEDAWEEEELVELEDGGHNLISEKTNYKSEEDIVLAYDMNAGTQNWIAIGKAGMDENGLLTSDNYIWDSYDNRWEPYKCTEEDTCDGGGLIIHNDKRVIPPGTYQAYLCAGGKYPPYHIKATTEPFVVEGLISYTNGSP